MSAAPPQGATELEDEVRERLASTVTSASGVKKCLARSVIIAIQVLVNHCRHLSIHATVIVSTIATPITVTTVRLII